jgi:hypothetical protein
MDAIDVRGGRRANAAGRYPPVLGSPNELRSFSVQIYSSDWRLVAERRFFPAGTANKPETAVRVFSPQHRIFEGKHKYFLLVVIAVPRQIFPQLQVQLPNGNADSPASPFGVHL